MRLLVFMKFSICYEENIQVYIYLIRINYTFLSFFCERTNSFVVYNFFLMIGKFYNYKDL